MARKKKGTSRKWLQAAKQRMEKKGTVGKFTAWCKRQGYTKVTQACIDKAKAVARKRGDTQLLREAIFAENVRKIARRRKRKKK